jgi:hypothetical protein
VVVSTVVVSDVVVCSDVVTSLQSSGPCPASVQPGLTHGWSRVHSAVVDVVVGGTTPAWALSAPAATKPAAAITANARRIAMILHLPLRKLITPFEGDSRYVIPGF